MPDEAFFPDLFVPWDVITRGEIVAFESALNDARDENDMQRFLERHPLMLIQQISGGRDAWVIPKKRLGSEHVTDFLVAQRESSGFVWYAVELERPQAKMFNKNGDPSAALNHALRQISDWRDWLSYNRDYAVRSPEQSGHGLIDIDPELEGLIIIGRDSDIDRSTTQRWRRLTRERRVKIETYDWLLSQARQRFQRYQAIERERRQTDLPRAANEITDWLKISGLTDFEVPGPAASMYFTNIDPAEYSKANILVFSSTVTLDIPPKFNDFIAKVEQILGEVNARLEGKTYYEPHDYVALTPSGVISSAQAEKIVQAGKNSSIKYLLTALVYTEPT